ncbi:hypothetical protein OQJ68_00580 [Microbulbifer thermotolerans]|uniref:Uncharacterized protein n=1 Tax=Microbulbifer thermotolerans TaxID=252514 RepID=A0AB35HTL8_MICTH|nr:hypothetical protein [Microbulbifer thermotolerans]MCX2800276.1 hypothetical protein [Microbulbifer thermotolerans]
MPEILPTTAILSVFASVLAIIDCYIAKKKRKITENSDLRSDRLSDLVVLTPFLALLYTENFWLNLVCTLPIILTSFLAQTFFYRKGWLASPPEFLTLSPGSYLLAVVGYFIFFHQGFLGDSNMDSALTTAGESKSPYSWLNLWPYAAYLVFFLFATTRKSTNGIYLSILIMVLAVNILPFFTGYYWWSMLAGFCILAVTVRRAMDVLEPGSGGAVSFVGGYFYLITAFGSILAYAILY